MALYCWPSIGENRRLLPGQILTVNRLKVGMTVTKVYSHIKGYTEQHVIKEIKENYFTYISEGSIQKCFYSDSNLTQYESGWNQTNYLIKGVI